MAQSSSRSHLVVFLPPWGKAFVKQLLLVTVSDLAPQTIMFYIFLLGV